METIRLVYPVEGGDLIEAGEASSKMKLTLKKLGPVSYTHLLVNANGGEAPLRRPAYRNALRHFLSCKNF